eukprot:221134-Prymnesium_polylepis.2
MSEAVSHMSPVMAAYFVLIVLIGTYLIMNLFLVVLLQLFTLEMSMDNKSMPTTADDGKADATSGASAAIGAVSAADSELEAEEPAADELNLKKRQNMVRAVRAERAQAQLDRAHEMEEEEERKSAAEPWPHDYNLYLFGPRSRVRHACATIVEHDAFGRTILLLIV